MTAPVPGWTATSEIVFAKLHWTLFTSVQVVGTTTFV